MNAPPLTPALIPGTTFTVIGLGGVGSLLATRILGLFLANRQEQLRLVLVDGDDYEPDNASRQWFRRPGSKAVIVKEELLEIIRGGTSLTVLALPEFVTGENLGRIIPGTGRQVVVLAVDNHKTRNLVSRHIETLQLTDDAEIALFSGGNDPADQGHRGSYGNVQVFIRRPNAMSVPLTQYHPEISEPQDALPTELSCTEQLDRRPQILASNSLVAAFLFSSIYLYLCGIDRLPYSELFFDFAVGRARPADYSSPQSALQRTTATASET